ncbi:MAG: hypothetical protein K8R46_05385, partial [Pirellulales bacterium]|nr:hypothetical protein [Pirellulales bacterium]
EATARRVEAEFPELGSDLINIVQLREGRDNQNRAFCDAAVNRAAAEIARLPFDRAAVKEPRLQRFIHCIQTPRDLAESLAVLALLIVVALFCRALLPNWGSAASRLFAPWTFVPSVGSVEIVGVTPGDADVLVGESVRISAEIRNPDGQPHQATLFIAKNDRPETPLPMTADRTHRRYTLTVPSAIEAFTYRLEIGDSQTRVYSIGVRQKPVVESAEATFHYPAYLERRDETIVLRDLNIEAPRFTEVELRLRPSTPVAKGYVEREGGRFTGRVEPDGSLAISSMPLLKDSSYVVRLWNDAGHSHPNPRVNSIRVRVDGPPTVELRGLGRSTIAAPGATLPVTIRAGDDHGIGRVQLQMMVKPKFHNSPLPLGEGPGVRAAEVDRQWTDFAAASTSVVRQYGLKLDPEKIKPGQTVLIRAAAWDKLAIDDWGLNLKPQETVGPWREITIISKDDEASAALERLDSLRGELMKILEKQVRARTAAADIKPRPSVAPRGESGGTSNGATNGRGFMLDDLRNKQIDIQKSSSELAKTINPAVCKELQTIKRVLSELAYDEMLQAVAICDEMLKLAAAKDFIRPTMELTAAQDRIIDVLRKLLDVARRAQADLLAEMEKRPGGDLPDDTRRKLDELRDKLEKFLEQQKKVIEASKELAKTPVDDFTEEQEELLKGLAAAEDDLSRFIRELQSDLSKLPEQDFANPSTAKELIEIQTELKMAEGALLKKTVDIAVPLEQLGYEMAEELKTNLEKWLPDSPDREKWSQEESLTDADKEAPMAELPGELEDLVGELMEEEEDLFDEMDDISSSAADSLDAGAGWDAMDGPISNMSAKGVTGNRLPNTSEIGGRAGEGRQGKSSGEFVGDEAVGKGGRKTPSRLTPDPNVAGQIKDHDRQPASGATGGGKESGKGGEGLEGPAPRSPGPRDAQRLAGRQAELRNKAEGIDLRFKVSGFHRTDLKKLIEIMAQIERDLKAGRYKNALRQRRVLLDGLGSVKQHLDGEFQTRRDASANLPADVRKELLGSMH